MVTRFVVPRVVMALVMSCIGVPSMPTQSPLAIAAVVPTVVMGHMVRGVALSAIRAVTQEFPVDGLGPADLRPKHRQYQRHCDDACYQKAS